MVPGRVYELRALLIAPPGTASGLGWAEARIEFYSASNVWIDPRIVGPDFQVPHLDPLCLETLPELPRTDQLHDAALASRFFVAPPDAVEVRVIFPDLQPEIAQLEIAALGIDWATDGRRVVEDIIKAASLRRSLLETNLNSSVEIPARDRIDSCPATQIKTIQAQFNPAGDWEAVLAELSTAAEAADFEERVARSEESREHKLTVAFIGSGRTYARLSCIADVVLVRESDWRERLLGVTPDLVVIETVAESLLGDWRAAFYSLTGAMPDSGRAFCRHARERDIPIRLHVTAGRDEMGVWAEMLECADAVVVEGEAAAWADFHRADAIVPRGAEPTATPALRTGTADGTMLVPVASDVFQYPEFAAIVREASRYAALFTEFHYAFAPHALAARLTPAIHPMVTLESRNQRTQLLQESTIVLLNGESLRTDDELLDIVLDAVCAGAIPVLVGRTRLSGPLVERLDRVWSAPELQEVQRLYRIPWLRERHWRRLFRTLNSNYVWRSGERAALLGKDPCPASFDAPRITAIMVSKRPNLLATCLETFRKQTWTDKELILVLNIDSPPDQWPELHHNECLCVLPENWTIGRCLNAAIAKSNGCYWAKMDDDDYYSSNYLKELCYYYRATQADAVGRQANLFFFAKDRQTWSRTKFFSDCFRKVAGGKHVSGATLSGKVSSRLPPFFNFYRNAADSKWVELLKMKDTRFVCYDGSSVTVYRDHDESKHTWAMTGLANWRAYSFTCTGNIHYALESGEPESGN